jgi:hypothetical protein
MVQLIIILTFILVESYLEGDFALWEFFFKDVHN